MTTSQKTFILIVTLLIGVSLSGVVQAQAGSAAKKMTMKKPVIVTISGKLADLSCAAKGQYLMGSDNNALNDTHMTPKGEMEKCATMCLKGGQPAGIFSDGKVIATLLANSSLNLYKFAAKDVDVQGWWAGNKKNDVKTFFPNKIRVKGTKDWTEVQTAQMH